MMNNFIEDEKSIQKNVLGQPLEPCCKNPMTGYFRDGYCHIDQTDLGNHSVCVKITQDFLDFSKAIGNDLSTPFPQYGFPGLKSGDKWCLCAARWNQAFKNFKAPSVYLASTNQSALEVCNLEELKSMALDLDDDI